MALGSGKARAVESEASDLAVARRAWRSLGERAKRRVLEELLLTRGDEIRRAYPDIVGLSWGFRTKRVGRGRRCQTQLQRSPCLKMLVRRKWPRGRVTKRGAYALPRHFFQFAGRGRLRILCAVPTDVESTEGVRALGGTAGSVHVTRANSASYSDGVIAAVVRVEGDDRLFGLGCQHVFGMTHAFSTHPTGATVSARPGGEALGVVTGHRGLLTPNSTRCFDAALAELTPSTGLSGLVPPLPSVLIAKKLDDIPKEHPLHVYTADGLRKKVTWVANYPPGNCPIRYEQPNGSEADVIFDVVLVKFKAVGDATIKGDSGSPVIDPDTGRLLGMLIAGDETHFSYMIPSFELVEAYRYIGLDESARITVTTRY